MLCAGGRLHGVGDGDHAGQDIGRQTARGGIRRTRARGRPPDGKLDAVVSEAVAGGGGIAARYLRR